MAETDRFVGGPFGKLANLVVAKIVRRSFKADLGKLKEILEAEAHTDR